ncbi:hypothetical protein MJG53_006480 [Ovis ammon polii x Ovis aries]|uniref:Uncharacterized protein n=3 Tax=Ovis TaxID=9935 RepID=A0AC11D1V5_SHEEP|nr:hypothetical protein MG293_006445 [Ovis ammon polii]KAI4584946.1 hypothetical protein MJG53_006480 [Ovis ammon polii x Ovis aries]
MSLVIPERFQHILRVLNTNIDGRRKIAFAITAVKGVGRRYAHAVLRKADIDLTKRAGELTEDEVERVITIMQNPRQYKIPDWFLNRQNDEGRKIQPCPGQRSRQQTPRRPGAPEEDSGPQGAAPLLGTPLSRPAHQDHRPPRSRCGCVQEEICVCAV